MFRRLILPVLFLCTIIAAGAVPPAHLGDVIDGMIRSARHDAPFQGAKIGIVIQSLDDDSLWYAKLANEPFIPASTAKLVTASLALEYLPDDFRFTTQAFATADVFEGVLPGNLILRGGGDPTLVPDDLRSLAHALATGDAARGIPPVTRITGRIILDDSAFPRRGPQLGPDWETEDLPWYYAAPSTALSCNRNAVMVTVCGSTHGQPPEITLTPGTKLFTVVNKAVTSANLTTGSIDVAPAGYHVTITGKVAPGAVLTEKISIPDPARLLAEQFGNALSAEGITVLGHQLNYRQPGLLLAEHQSAPLAEVIYGMLKDSDNHTAEQLRWTLLAQLQRWTWLHRRFTAIQHDLARRIGITPSHLQLVDGSGLSRSNALRPGDMVRLLAYMSRSPHSAALYQAMPVAGVDGTLKKRMIGTAAEGNAHAKTGTMRGVSALAGYVSTTHGEHLVCAVFVNGYQSGAANARDLQDGIVSYLAGL